MDAVVETTALTKRYGSVMALADCDLALPRGRSPVSSVRTARERRR